MKKALCIFSLLLCTGLVAQLDSISVDSIKIDSVMNKDAVFSRPALLSGKLPISIGGYAEVNTSFTGTDGATEGLQFQMRRFTLYTFSKLHHRLRFAAEIEFEDGAKEISIESSFLDLELDPALIFRGGIIVNPIGAFNQNHDGPKWNFVDRPLSCTEIIPTTWSNAGFGIHGKFYPGKSQISYEIYLSNGFDDAIISNDHNRTWLGASMENEDRFEENNNGQPLITSRWAYKHHSGGEIGLSWMGGVYNSYRKEGLVVDDKRRVDVLAIDYSVGFKKGTKVSVEYVWVNVEVPETYSQQYGQSQHGYYLDLSQRMLHRKFLGFEKSAFYLGFRFEGNDLNVGKFNETGGNIYDENNRFSAALSWRPVPETVFRFNYYFQTDTDILGNPPAKTGGFLFGLATYF